MPAVRENEIVPGFFEALKKFSNESSRRTFERMSDKPHVLTITDLPRNNYLNTLFGHAHDVLKNAYSESNAHTYYNMLECFASSAGRKLPACEWSALFPQVREIISAHGDKTQAAFETLFNACRAYERSVGDAAVRCMGDETPPVLTNEEASGLKAALETIWAAYPDMDPRVVEGADYVLESTPSVQILSAFDKVYSNGTKRIYARCWDERSDSKLAEWIEHPEQKRSNGWNTECRPEATVALARQAAENLTTLKPFSKAIAIKSLGNYLRMVSGLSEQKSTAAAEKIMTRLDKEGASVKDMARKIQKGRIAPFRGDHFWSSERTEAKKLAQCAEQYLLLCRDVQCGVWFDNESRRLLAYANKVAGERLPWHRRKKPRLKMNSRR